MKKSKLVMLLLAVIMAICVPLAACSKADYSLDKDSATLTVGETLQLNVTSTKDGEFTVVWASDDENVATVSESGLVTAKVAGEANVTATVDGKELTCAVTVKEVEYSYSLNKTSATLEEEETLQLSVTAKPAKTLTIVWSTSDDKVAKVSSSGLVTAVAEGKATIKAVVDGKELTCAVTVEKAPVFYTYLLNMDSARLEKGTTAELELTCDDREDEFTVTWASADEEIATVDEDGVVTAVGVGKTDITATVDGDEVAACEVTVFEYVYTFEKNISVDYGDTDKTLTVGIDPVKPINIKYEVGDEDVITVSADGKITTVGVGETIVTVKDGEKVLGTCAVKVNYVLEFIESLQLHSGDTHTLEVVCTPANPDLTVVYEVTEGDAVSVSGSTLTAEKDGAAVVKATAGESELFCNVLVNDVNAAATMTKLTLDKENPYDITAGAEYWEQYISTAEINHKQYASVEEDIIERTCTHTGKFLSDYKAFLTWTGGANKTTCDCGNCDKETHTGGDNGWTDGGTKAYCVDVKGAVITLTVKVFAGDSKISVYTGGYNIKENVILKNGEVVIAEAEIDNKGVHNSNLVEFEVNVTKTTDVTVELVFADDYGDTGHSVISLAAVSVTGSVYRLEETSARVVPGTSTQISVTKDGEPATGATYKVISGADYASVDENGTVTGITAGEATVEVTIDGRVRYFTVNVGYGYTLNHTSVQLHTGNSVKLETISEPAGGDAVAVFEVTEGEDVVSVADDGTVTALKDGNATVKVTVDGNELFCTVLVNGVNATVTKKDLTTSSVETLSGSDVAYWEQYINNEVNYKAISSEEEDVIKREYLVGNTGYFGDYAKLIWTDGDSRCVKPSKPDGFSEGATLKIREIGDNEVKAQLTVNVFAGKTTIKVYTGVFKGTNTVTLYNGETAIASYELRDDGTHIRNLLTFEVDVAEACEIRIVLALTNPKADNSFLTLVAASVSGSTYRLDKYSARVMTGGTEQITVKKDGEAYGGAAYESLDTEIATVDNSGLVTAVKAGEARIKVTVDGRVRYFAVEVIDNYIYTLKETSATVKVGNTYQIAVESEPVTSDIEAAYSSGDEAIATVSGTGLITGVAKGETTVTVTVGETVLTFNVTVAEVEVQATGKDIDGEFVDLTQDNVLYYEHYIWNELATKKLADGEKDLIDVSLGSEGDAGYNAYVYFAGADGTKAAAGNDKAYRKFNKFTGELVATVTVPVGTYEIRVYAGAWEASVKTALYDGEQEIAAYEFNTPSNGSAYLVTFKVTVTEEKVFTVKLNANGTWGRLAAISIATPDVKQAATTTVTATATETEGDTVTKVNLSEAGNLDWIYYNTEFGGGNNGNIAKKATGSYINNEIISSWNEWDYRAGITWSDGDGNFNATEHPDGDAGRLGEGYNNNFVADELRLLATVKVDQNVNTITLYASGYQSTYNVFIYDSKGNLLIDQAVCAEAGGNSKAYIITVNVTATQAETLRVGIRKVSGNNIGLSAIAVSGTAE